MSDLTPTFYFIPHTHWEGAVFKTRQEYLDMGLPNILRALQLLQTYPDYRFVLDQAAYVKPFLERYPEAEGFFRQCLAEGRLGIAGGLDVMPDVNMPCGESFVRQVLYGKGFFRRELGIEVTSAWLLDTFGHHAQLPQLLRQGGYRAHWFFRGVPGWDTPSEFIWQGLDGTQIPAFWLPFGYAHVYRSPSEPQAFDTFIETRYDELAPFTQRTQRVSMAGADVSQPELHVPPLAAGFNQRREKPFRLEFSLPGIYENLVEEDQGLPVLGCELNPIFQGTYSSRIELKQRLRKLETDLLNVEKLGAILRWLGADPIANGTPWQAWEPVLFNQAHDLMSGVMTDHVYEDTLRGYDFAARLGEEALQVRLHFLAAQADTRGEGLPLVVFNPLGWQRSDLAVVEVGFSQPGIRKAQLVDAEYKPLPFQVLDCEQDASGGVIWARLAFIAQDVPSMGLKIYHLLPDGEQIIACPDLAQAAGAEVHLENDLYQLKLDAVSGALVELVDKPQDWQVLKAPGNVVVMEADHGDLWEPYHALDGGSRIAMQTPHPPPPVGEAVFSTEQSGEPGWVTRGAIFDEFSVQHPFAAEGWFSTRVRLYHGLKRIEFHTSLLNQDSRVRYRLLFPTSVQQGKSVHEIPFGAIQRPDGIEFPAQNWADTSDEARGLALLNRGLPGNNTYQGTLMLSLLRSASITAYAYIGGYEEGASSDSGLELGQERAFDYALLPHNGGWQDSGLAGAGLEFNHPLLAFTASPHPGQLVSGWSFLQVSHPQVILSALKPAEQNSPGEGGWLVLRLYESSGEEAKDVWVRFAAPLLEVETCNLMEDPGEKLQIVEDGVRLDFRAFEIKTLRFRLKMS